MLLVNRLCDRVAQPGLSSLFLLLQELLLVRLLLRGLPGPMIPLPMPPLQQVCLLPQTVPSLQQFLERQDRIRGTQLRCHVPFMINPVFSAVFRHMKNTEALELGTGELAAEERRRIGLTEGVWCLRVWLSRPW